MRLGLSEGPTARVLDLQSVGIDSAEAVFRVWQEGGARAFLKLLTGTMERIDLRSEVLVFPWAVSEIWGAGVTYERSRDARRDESEGWEDLYLNVYEAERPEIFFKHPGHRMAGPGDDMGLRPDAHWHVPEPELAVVVGPDGGIFGVTAGNDLSARDVEAANALYLPQAKVFHKSASLGPSIALYGTVDATSLTIRLTIARNAATIFSGSTSTALMRRSLEDLVHYTAYAWPLEPWTVIMTGTGIVPPDDFTLADGDEISIAIDNIGVLHNRVRTISPDWARLGS